MTLLTFCQRAASEAGLDVPSSVYANSDNTAVQLLSAARVELYVLSHVHPWQNIRGEHTFTTTAAALQTGGLPADFDYIIDNTFWDRTNRLPIEGPVTPQDWQRLQARDTLSSARNRVAYIRGSSLYIDPAPTVTTDTLAFEYASTYLVNSTDTEWVADTDTANIDENLLMLGMVWRLKKNLGSNYSDDFNTYASMVNRAIARDGGNKILSLSDMGSLELMVNIPDGDFPDS